jgi:hypothetical protein
MVKILGLQMSNDFTAVVKSKAFGWTDRQTAYEIYTFCGA